MQSIFGSKASVKIDFLVRKIINRTNILKKATKPKKCQKKLSF